MPLLSFVLVDEGGAAELEAGVDALLGPDLADVEVIAVGGDPALAERDPRVRPLPAPAGGLAAARDLGLEAARGEHVWFLEAGDRLAPGTLAGAAERLRAVAPDVLFVGRGPHRRLLDRVARDGVTTLERRPGLADAAPGLPGKALRREHLRRLEVRFGAGAGGELPVTWPALLAAERIAAAPAPRGEPPLRDPPPGGPPAEVFANYEAALATPARIPDPPAERRGLPLRAMLRRELRALEQLPRAARRAYFDALSTTWRAHPRGDEPIRGGRAARLEARLVER